MDRFTETLILFVSCRVSTIKKFPADMMDALRTMINKEHLYFLMLSRTEQELLVDKMLQKMVSSGILVSTETLQKNWKIKSQDFEYNNDDL